MKPRVFSVLPSVFSRFSISSKYFPRSASRKLLFSVVVLEKFPEFRRVETGIPRIL